MPAPAQLQLITSFAEFLLRFRSNNLQERKKSSSPDQGYEEASYLAGATGSSNEIGGALSGIAATVFGNKVPAFATGTAPGGSIARGSLAPSLGLLPLCLLPLSLQVLCP